MKILCPNCELWLVEFQMIEGEGDIYCVRCLDLDGRAQSDEVIVGYSDKSARAACCRLCDLGVFSS